jgi:hypothetical protein
MYVLPIGSWLLITGIALAGREISNVRTEISVLGSKVLLIFNQVGQNLTIVCDLG